MNEKEKAELEKKEATAAAEKAEADKKALAEQDPLKVELDRVQKQGKTEAEKAAFSLKKNAERARELGVDVDKVLGTKPAETDEDDDKPLTRGEFKKLQQEQSAKSALQLAEEIPNETERELTKYHLQNSIRSTGNPAEDLKLARALTNSARNSQILEEVQRKKDAKSHSNGSGVDAKIEENQGELTPQEMQFLGKPFNLTKAQIIAARPKK